MWVVSMIVLSFGMLLAEAELNPGFKVHLTQKGIGLLEDFTKDALKSYLDSDETKSLEGESGSMEYELSAIQVTNYDASYLTSMNLVAGRGFQINLKEFTFQIQSPYKVEYYFVWNNGHTTIDFHNVDLEVILGASQNGGHLEPTIESCRFTVEILTVDFTGGLINKLMNLFKSKIANRIKSLVEASLCNVIEERLQEYLVPVLASVPLSTKLFDKYSLDYSLIRSPMFGQSYLESEHNGGIHAINRVTSRDGGVKYMTDTIQNQFPAPIFSQSLPVGIPNEHNKMINLYLTEWVLDSLFYYLSKYQVLNLAFTRETMPSAYEDILSTNCEFLCIGTLYPKLAELYPKSTLDVMMTIAESPQTSIGPDGINITTVLNFTGYIRKLEQQNSAIPLNSTEFENNDVDFELLQLEITDGIPVFTGLADALVKLDLNIVEGTIIADLDFDSFELDSFTSQVEGISVDSFDFILDTVVSEFIQPHFAKLMKGGINLPKMGPFTIVEGLIQPVSDLLVFSVDFSID